MRYRAHTQLNWLDLFLSVFADIFVSRLRFLAIDVFFLATPLVCRLFDCLSFRLIGVLKVSPFIPLHCRDANNRGFSRWKKIRKRGIEFFYSLSRKIRIIGIYK